MTHRKWGCSSASLINWPALLRSPVRRRFLELGEEVHEALDDAPGRHDCIDDEERVPGSLMGRFGHWTRVDEGRLSRAVQGAVGLVEEALDDVGVSCGGGESAAKRREGLGEVRWLRIRLQGGGRRRTGSVSRTRSKPGRRRRFTRRVRGLAGQVGVGYGSVGAGSVRSACDARRCARRRIASRVSWCPMACTARARSRSTSRRRAGRVSPFRDAACRSAETTFRARSGGFPALPRRRLGRSVTGP